MDGTRRIRMVIETEPVHLNPGLDPDRWGYRLAQDAIYEPLWRALPDGTFEPVLAERFSIDEEGRRFTFHLRKGALFHDGEPLHSLDVAFTFDRLRGRTSHAARIQAALADLDRVELAGPDAVRIWATRPSVALQQAIAEIGILPEHVFARGELAYQAANRRPVGTGPLRLREWERGKRLVLERFPGYWGPPAAADEIEVLIDQDMVRALGRARRGEIDLLGHVPAEWVPEQLDSPTLRAHFRTVRTNPARFTFVVWNTAHEPLDDPAVRRALGIAIDRTRVLHEARHGVGRAIASPSLGGAKGPVTRFDPVRASATLESAGLPRSGDGPRMRGGRPVRLTLLVPSGSHEAGEAGRRVAEGLGKIGIATDIAAGDLGTILLRLRNGKFDGALLEWTGRDDDDLGPLFRTGGAQNFGKYSDRDVDALIDQLKRPAPQAERRALFGRLSGALDANPPALFLYAPDEVYLLARRLAPARPSGDFLLLRDLGPVAP
ncbi:MAG: hypothetical protein EXR72_11120 [Myxococcales bacterium]|nr:hypothetical protein [Myxococcales bacterium]